LVYKTSIAYAFAAQETSHSKRVIAAARTKLVCAKCVHTAVTVAGGVRPHVQGISGKHPTCWSSMCSATSPASAKRREW